MHINSIHFRKIASDLGIGVPFIKGQETPVTNCWHFCTDGNSIDIIFNSDDDFRAAMNRIYVVSLKYKIIILAFCLMDNHIHFILYGEYSECNAFIHDFIKRTSRHISISSEEHCNLDNILISHQPITDQRYLKTVISYVIKNPSSAGLPYTAWDYPWSSGALYFRSSGNWTCHLPAKEAIVKRSQTDLRSILKTKTIIDTEVPIIEGIVHPEEYVARDLVEKIFRTTKSFTFFLGSSKDSEVEERGGVLSNMSIPEQEIRKYKNEICIQMFGQSSLKNISIPERVELARVLRSKYGCSTKQLARVCGLRYDELVKVI